MFALFAAAGMVGVLGATTVSVMKGPVRTMHNVTQRTIAENNMIASGKLSLMWAGTQADGGDCDADGATEPPAWSTSGTGPYPTGGGYLPTNIGAALQDPWGNTYGFCSWDHGSSTQKTTPAPTCPTPMQRLQGASDSNGVVVAIISSGPDKVFQTSCGDAPTYVNKVSGSDDVILSYTFGEAEAQSAGLWKLKAGETTTAEIGERDIEIKGSGGADSARIGYDADLGKSGVGDFLAVRVNEVYAKEGNNTVAFQDVLRLKSVSGVAAPNTVAGDTLSNLICTSGQIAKWDGSDWVCADDEEGTDTLAGLSCSNTQIPKWNGSAWACAADVSGADNLGNHTATALLNMNNNRIDNLGITAFPGWHATYDVWIQGGTIGSSGTTRRLALLGDKANSVLYLNYNTEYASGVRIAGNVGINQASPATNLHVGGNIAATGWIGAGCEGACESSGGYTLSYADGRLVATQSVLTPQICNTSGTNCIAQSALGGGGATTVTAGQACSGMSCSATATATCPAGKTLIACHAKAAFCPSNYPWSSCASPTRYGACGYYTMLGFRGSQSQRTGTGQLYYEGGSNFSNNTATSTCMDEGGSGWMCRIDVLAVCL